MIKRQRKYQVNALFSDNSPVVITEQVKNRSAKPNKNTKKYEINAELAHH